MRFDIILDIDDGEYNVFKREYSPEGMSDDLFMEVLSIRLGSVLSRMSRRLRPRSRRITVEKREDFMEVVR